LALGVYTIDQLISYLNSTSLNTYMTFSYSSQTFKITISAKPNMVIALTSGLKNCYEVLGFDNFGTSQHNTLQAVWVAPYPFNMISTQILHITIPNLTLNSVGLKNAPNYSVIDSILVYSAPGEVQCHTDPGNFKFKIADQSISLINIQILNQDFNEVDFNNIDWFMCLSFSFIYKKDLIGSEYINSNESISEFYLLEQERRNLLAEIKARHIK
jgi:hypothetical protein